MLPYPAARPVRSTIRCAPAYRRQREAARPLNLQDPDLQGGRIFSPHKQGWTVLSASPLDVGGPDSAVEIEPVLCRLRKPKATGPRDRAIHAL
jgi:hypothetical protein